MKDQVNRSSKIGSFIGVGVGPGPSGYLPVAAYQALLNADIILVPKALSADQSIAHQCLSGLDLPADRLREVPFDTESARTSLGQTYATLAESIVSELNAGRNVAYITIGDSLTYSTYSYALEAVRAMAPEAPRHTFPGITSYAAAASSLEWPLGQGKERTLILPCPDDMDALQGDIQTHDLVVLIKIGHRLDSVLDLLRKLDIIQHCALASRIGLPGEIVARDLNLLPSSNRLGYLTTMLIRKSQVVPRQPLGTSMFTGAQA